MYLDGCEAHVQNPLDLETLNIYNDEWVTLCADGYTEEVGEVVCRELDHGEVANVVFQNFQETDYPISSYSYSCIGSENSICDCVSNLDECSSNRIVLIQCTPPGK